MLSRSDLIADVCIFGGALVLTAGAVVRPKRTGYRREVHRNLGKAMLGGAVVLVSMSDGMQVLIDRVSGIPNLGMLVRLVLLPIINYRSLALQDALIDAAPRRRRWHLGFAVGAVAMTIVCWQLGAPHTHALNTIPVAVPLGEANKWLYAIAWLFPIELILQCGSAARTAYRILLHVYVTGYDRVTCLSSLLFGLAQVCFAAVGVGLLLYPPGQATGHLTWIDISTFTTEFFGVTGAFLSLLAYSAPLWGSHRRYLKPAEQEEAPAAGRFERLLGVLLTLSSYGSIRRLALHLQDVLPRQYVYLGRAETRLWCVRRASDLDLLLQLFKTVINDARLALVPYVSQTASGSPDPTQVAQALDDALAHYQRRQRPVQVADDNPLRQARLFNDERFLAAVWHAYKSLRHRAV